jgi:hypothetical protein
MKKSPSSFKPSSQEEPEWIELPGLFEQWEIANTDGLEVRAQPLIVSRGRVFYGVYVREIARFARPRRLTA